MPTVRRASATFDRHSGMPELKVMRERNNCAALLRGGDQGLESFFRTSRGNSRQTEAQLREVTGRGVLSVTCAR